MSRKTHFKLLAAVYIIFVKNKKILLLRRFNTGWADGYYALPAGHLDGNETVIDCAVREAKEEVNITISRENLKVVHIMHRVSDKEYIDFFLTVSYWKGEPKNMEQKKADDLQWFSLNKLPFNVTKNSRLGIEHSLKNKLFSEYVGGKGFSWYITPVQPEIQNVLFLSRIV